MRMMATPNGECYMIRCRDIPGPCCHECHNAADDGDEGLDGLIGDQGVVVARVCCFKRAEAKRWVDNPSILPAQPLSLLGGECYR